MDKVLCDSCHKDITTSGNSESWRLLLKCEANSGSGPVTDFGDEPELDRPYRFCNLLCLHNWLDKIRLPEEPRYEHDCTWCVFLGQYGDNDLYFCPGGGNPTVIARHSDEGSDYQSGLGINMPDLVEAERRARLQGLIQ